MQRDQFYTIQKCLENNDIRVTQVKGYVDENDELRVGYYLNDNEEKWFCVLLDTGEAFASAKQLKPCKIAAEPLFELMKNRLNSEIGEVKITEFEELKNK